MGRGTFPDSHPLCLGMPGMHGNYTAVTAMQKADLLIALGSRFDDRVTGKVSAFAPEAKIIHVDIDPAELGKVRRPDVAVVGDARIVIGQIIEALAALGLGGRRHHPGPRHPGGSPSRSRALDGPGPRLAGGVPPHLRPDRGRRPEAPVRPRATPRHVPRRHHRRLRRRPAPDVGLAVLEVQPPLHLGQLGGAGTMGFAVPAAIGAKVGRPDKTVWAVDGDGCFQMTAQELVTASAERIPVKVAILNNAYLGMVRQWQELFYAERYSEVYLSPDLPDYVKWAEAMGCVGLRVESAEEVAPAIDKANGIDDRPVVIDFRTDAFEKVYPMVPAGASNDDIIVGPSEGEGGR
jgi:acetolactate synthase-1/2/3 large subunit